MNKLLVFCVCVGFFDCSLLAMRRGHHVFKAPASPTAKSARTDMLIHVKRKAESPLDAKSIFETEYMITHSNDFSSDLILNKIGSLLHQAYPTIPLAITKTYEGLALVSTLKPENMQKFIKKANEQLHDDQKKPARIVATIKATNKKEDLLIAGPLSKD